MFNWKKKLNFNHDDFCFVNQVLEDEGVLSEESLNQECVTVFHPPNTSDDKVRKVKQLFNHKGRQNIYYS